MGNGHLALCALEFMAWCGIGLLCIELAGVLTREGSGISNCTPSFDHFVIIKVHVYSYNLGIRIVNCIPCAFNS